MQTIKVQPWGDGQGDFVTINAEDFDPAFHVCLDGEGSAETSVAAAIPESWQALHWKQRVALAKGINPEAGEIDAKAADAIIAAEVLNRVIDEPQDAAGGLTIRELRADIAGLGLEVDPTMAPADLLALRDETRAARG